MNNPTGGPTGTRAARPLRPDSLAAAAAFRQRLKELGAELLEPEWLGNRAKHHVRCRAGHDCYPRPNSLRQGQGPCRTCAGQDPEVVAAAFRARLAAIGATLLEPEWLGAMRKHHVRCKNGHDCYPTPNGIQQGRGPCGTCAGKNPAANEAAFKARLAELGVELLEPYINSAARHRARCAAGHECWPRPGGIQQGEGPCITCAGKDPRVSEAAFRARLAKEGAEPLYEAWLGVDRRHSIRCAAGHTAAPRPSDVAQGGNLCRTCSGKDPAASEAKFLARLADLGATPLYKTWRGSHQRHHVRCSAGHDCHPTPSDVCQGSGLCRFCMGKAWDAFYVVTGGGVVKFGVTSGDPRPRLRVHAFQGYTDVVRLATGLPGSVALDAERAILAALTLAGEKPVRGREYFDESCLALILDVADSWLTLPPTGPDAQWVQEELFAA